MKKISRSKLLSKLAAAVALTGAGFVPTSSSATPVFDRAAHADGITTQEPLAPLLTFSASDGTDGPLQAGHSSHSSHASHASHYSGSGGGGGDSPPPTPPPPKPAPAPKEREKEKPPEAAPFHPQKDVVYVVTMKNDNVYKGTVVEDKDTYTITAKDSSTTTVKKADVASIEPAK